ncbi:hypothetical protein NDU88_006185 [Pleurodeles waltl]|uniref:Reverse transcriptase n=1 Tax=Pleurodeles waltl TaxID=8319 RepID=A0AAV7LNB8_PLEWA|nr:hypothetical protein NDU88_006185 [Pleurodeles waltl]
MGWTKRCLLSINAAFCDYYLTLYALPEAPLPDTLHDLLAGMQLRTLTEEAAALLYTEVTADEVKLAIGGLATGKIPGRDGLPLKFYKLTVDILAPRLHRLQSIYGGEPRACPRCRAWNADLRHMVWGCPTLGVYWAEVKARLNLTLDRSLPVTLEVSLLGLLVRKPTKKVGNRFIDLSLVLAWRRIAITRKTPEGPGLTTWVHEVTCWAGVEERTLRREESQGLRRQPIAHLWAEIMEEWEAIDCLDDAHTEPGAKEGPG